MKINFKLSEVAIQLNMTQEEVLETVDQLDMPRFINGNIQYNEESIAMIKKAFFKEKSKPVKKSRNSLHTLLTYRKQRIEKLNDIVRTLKASEAGLKVQIKAREDQSEEILNLKTENRKLRSDVGKQETKQRALNKTILSKDERIDDLEFKNRQQLKEIISLRAKLKRSEDKNNDLSFIASDTTQKLSKMIDINRQYRAL